MGKRYCFYCRECEIKLTLFEEVGQNSKHQVHNYYCSQCEKIVYHDICLNCQSNLERVIEIPINILENTNEKAENVECPRCNSLLTVIVFLGEWD